MSKSDKELKSLEKHIEASVENEDLESGQKAYKSVLRKHGKRIANNDKGKYNNE